MFTVGPCSSLQQTLVISQYQSAGVVHINTNQRARHPDAVALLILFGSRGSKGCAGSVLRIILTLSVVAVLKGLCKAHGSSSAAPVPTRP
jgi:hypothetical protein